MDSKLMFRRAIVVDGQFAEQHDGVSLEPTQRGDDVTVLAFGYEEGFDICFHLRRGMTAEDVAEGLEATARAIREETQ